ncbi:MAG: cytochrome c oxidase subunit II, partial [Puniceicoccaceae bacterium]
MPEHLSGHQSTFVTEGPLARMQLDLFYVTLWVTTFIFITVGGVLAYAQIKFKAKKGEERSEPPAQTHGNPLVELGLIVASIGLLVIIAIPTVRGIWYMETIPYDDEDMVEIVATGYQWWFRFDYTDLGFTTANEVVIPAGRNVHFHLRTNDVIHSFWIPRLAGKKDMIPNRANSMWIRADGPGYYWGHCAEFCGESHANMRF